MSTMSPWVRTDAGTGAGTSTGAVTFDLPGEFDLQTFDDPADGTPLNLDDLPNIGLGAVLRSWEGNLAQGCRLRPPGLSHRFYGGARAVTVGADDFDVVVTAGSGITEAARGTASSVERMPGNITANIVGVGSVKADLPFSECRIVVPPLVASGSFQRQFFVLITGDDAVHFSGDARDDNTNATRLPTGPGDMSAVEVIGELQELLQVAAAAILRATGISRRTYQHWKQTGATSRLSSEARLWDLVLTARGWADALGDDLPAWIRTPERLALLQAGSFGELTNQVLSARVQAMDPGEARYRDRLASGYFETADDVHATTEQGAERGGEVKNADRAVRRAGRARRPGALRRSNT